MYTLSNCQRVLAHRTEYDPLESGINKKSLFSNKNFKPLGLEKMFINPEKSSNKRLVNSFSDVFLTEGRANLILEHGRRFNTP